MTGFRGLLGLIIGNGSGVDVSEGIGVGESTGVLLDVAFRLPEVNVGYASPTDMASSVLNTSVTP
jgi:hypothetical protein